MLRVIFSFFVIAFDFDFSSMFIHGIKLLQIWWLILIY